MKKTEDIVIKVPSEVAEAYRKATEDEREQIQLKLSAILQMAMSRKDAIHRLRETMNEISEEARAKGLTPEILESILNDER